MFPGRDMIKRIPWPQLFVEAALVVLSVLLALALNSWHQARNHEALAEQALRNIADEVGANKAGIEEALGYHEMLLDSLPGASGRATALKPAIIQDNAWETAQATQAVIYLDYDVAALVSEIHELQEIYQQIVRASIQTVYLNVSPGSVGSSAIRPMVMDLHDVERLLLEKYGALQERIDP